MAKYINITTETTTTLITKNLNTSGLQHGGAISSVSVSNNSASEATISVYLEDSSTSDEYHLVNSTLIPSGVTLVLTDHVSFDINKYSMLILNSGNNPNLTVITN